MSGKRTKELKQLYRKLQMGTLPEGRELITFRRLKKYYTSLNREQRSRLK